MGNHQCPQHPQANVWHRTLPLPETAGMFSTCAICGDPLDPVLRKALHERAAESRVTRRTILGWQRHAYAIARSKGWYSDTETLWQWIGGLMAEAAELWNEARKSDFEPTRTYYGEGGKPEGLGAELADVVMRAMNIASAFGIDLEAAIAEKSAWNERREYRHGNKRA